MVNAPELLRVYLDYDCLDEATLLSCEYIDAVMGCGAEYFNIKSCLRFGSGSVWIPYTSLDHLLAALEEGKSTDIRYLKLCSAGNDMSVV